MSKIYRLLAFDLGAESGRAILGSLKDGRITLEEIHRFPTKGIVMLGTRQWDLTRIYGEMLTALAKCSKAHGPHLDGIGVDTWGVDFGLITSDGTPLANPVHYRDRRTEGMMEAAFEIVPREEIYHATGIQFFPYNTIYQLLALVRSNSLLLKVADSLLMMGDLFAYLLCGRRACEYTNASTTQLLEPWKKTWNETLIKQLGLPRHLFLELVPPGTVLGEILPEVAAATGLNSNVPVIAPATHDTASAVAAIPAEENHREWAYLSSGTWSLLGAELDAPQISEESLALNFSNEGGVGGKIRFLKNIIGLWLVQECRRAWDARGQELSYADLIAEAELVEPFGSLIDVDDQRLMAPEDMPELIRVLCRETGQPEPSSRGALVRCALESLALKYRRTLRALDRVLGRKTQQLHIIGGGAQNYLLCQLTADACGVPVLAGPVEATALGNIVVQAMAVGAIDSLTEARRVISRSMKTEGYQPVDTDSWENMDINMGRKGSNGQ